MGTLPFGTLGSTMIKTNLFWVVPRQSYTHKSFKKIMGLGAISFEKHFSLKQFIEASGNRQRCMFLRCLLLSQQKIILHFTDITDF
jgi:hypothetical protein